MRSNSDGYKEQDGQCLAFCKNCRNGNCVAPELCECDPGYVGDSCSDAVDSTDGPEKLHEYFEFEFHLKGQKNFLWICASLLTLLIFVVIMNACCFQSQTETSVANVDQIDGSNKYAGNLVLAAASTSNPKASSAGVQWTNKPFDRSKLMRRLTVVMTLLQQFNTLKKIYSRTDSINKIASTGK